MSDIRGQQARHSLSVSTHHSFHFNFATVEVCDRTREAIRLRERANDLHGNVRRDCAKTDSDATYLDLVSEDLGRGPVHQCLVLVHTVNHDCAAPPHIVDALLCKLLHTRRLDDDIESIRIVLLELLPLGARILAVKLDVLVPRFQLSRNVHLDALVRRNDDLVRAILLEQLGQDEASRARAEKQDINSDWRVELV